MSIAPSTEARSRFPVAVSEASMASLPPRVPQNWEGLSESIIPFTGARSRFPLSISKVSLTTPPWVLPDGWAGKTDAFTPCAGARSRLPYARVLPDKCVVMSEFITPFPGARSRNPRLITGAFCNALAFKSRYSSAAPIAANRVFEAAFDSFRLKPRWVH